MHFKKKWKNIPHNWLEKYQISFIYNVGAYLKTLEMVKGLKARLFVPAHAPVGEDMGELAQYNIDKVHEIAGEILKLCREPICFEVILKGLFARYGLQADGSRKAEPETPFAMNFDDRNWRQLDLPHDWGIEGPFRQDLEGGTGKSMNTT